jgi:nitroreductase
MSENRIGMALVAELVESSRIGAAESAHAEIPAALRGHRLGAVSAARAPAPLSAGQADAVLQARKSVRSFSSRPVPAGSIGASVDAAIAADRELWPEENAGGVDLELVLVAWSVDGLEPGVYVREGESFRFLKQPPERGARGSVTLQRGLQAAPALVLASGNLLASCARHGDHGYRLLLARAGAACQTAWLAAIDEGLAGVVFAGFQPAAARHIFGPSMARRQLFALALGCPPDEAST